MTSSTMSSESAPRSSTNEAVLSTWFSSTPNCSTIICFTFCSTAMLPPEWDTNSLILASLRCDSQVTDKLKHVPRSISGRLRRFTRNQPKSFAHRVAAQRCQTRAPLGCVPGLDLHFSQREPYVELIGE